MNRQMFIQGRIAMFGFLLITALFTSVTVAQEAASEPAGNATMLAASHTDG